MELGPRNYYMAIELKKKTYIQNSFQACHNNL